MFDYKGKVVAITGATGGVGKQMAEGFAKVGANLVLLTSDLKRAETVGKELEEKYGVKALPLMCDVTSPESIDAAVSKVYEVFGHCEVIINNLGSVKGVGNPLENYNQAN